MRKVILNVAVSLDGLIEGPNGEYDWCLDDQDYGLTEFFGSIDAIFIGRKSYDMIRAQPDMFPGKKMYVFSDTLNRAKTKMWKLLVLQILSRPSQPS
jgi:dihydrofolate reductase